MEDGPWLVKTSVIPRGPWDGAGWTPWFYMVFTMGLPSGYLT